MLEHLIHKSKVLCVLAGLVRGVIWFFLGKLNKPGAHLLVHAKSTDQVLCVNPSSETYLRWLHGWPYICHLPGGGVGTDETAREAVTREVAEELLVNSLDLSSADRRELTIRFGKLRNRVTVFFVQVASPEDFQCHMPGGGEFVSPPAWRSLKDAHRYGNAGMRTALRAFNKSPAYST